MHFTSDIIVLNTILVDSLFSRPNLPQKGIFHISDEANKNI